MKQKLFSNEVILEDDRVMKLDYSIVEKRFQTDAKDAYYGISITKHLDGIVESDEVSGISSSRDWVVDVIKKLFQFEVTPITMVEILDDLVTQGL